MAAENPASSDQLIPFGHAMLEHFPFDAKHKNLNHGSFGSLPKVVMEARRRHQDEAEAAPDKYLRFTRGKYIQNAREAVAKVLKAPVKDVGFVKNATAGVNTVLRNLVYSPGDVILYFSDIYPACEKTVAHLIETTPVRSRRVAYIHPMSHDIIVQRFREEVKKVKAEGLNARVAIFDTIVSQPGVRFPFEKLTEVCREEGVLSLIDGAHGIGHIPLDLGKMQPDFFVSNCHKWLFTPRGSAVFYVSPRSQHLLRTTFPTSHGFIAKPWTVGSTAQPLVPDPDHSYFEALFDWVATDDDSAYMCVPDAIEFRKTRCGGEDAIMSYCDALAHKAGNRVADILGTEVLTETGVDREVQGVSKLRQCAFANVRLPISIVDEGKTTSGPVYPVSVKAGDIYNTARWIERELVDKHNTVVPLFRHGDGIWVRLSAQIYLELSDFEWVAEVLKGMVERVGKGEAPVSTSKA